MWGLVLTLVVILLVIGALVLVIYSLHQREQLAVTVESSYVVKFSVAEAQLYENLKMRFMRDVACKSSMESVEFAEFVKKQLSDPERKKLKAMLVKRLMAVIEPLRSIQADRKGIPALAQRKLVSEEFLASFVQTERTLNEEIELVLEQADLIEPDWSKSIFTQAVNFWRLEMEQKRMTQQAANQ
jgi:hypothetical protein